jgi:translation initiation factor 2-alpha kinase 4
LDYSDEKLSQKTKNEAILLSRLHHTRIVRYYQAWTEEINEYNKKYSHQLTEDSNENDENKL